MKTWIHGSILSTVSQDKGKDQPLGSNLERGGCWMNEKLSYISSLRMPIGPLKNDKIQNILINQRKPHERHGENVKSGHVLVKENA